MPRLDRDAAVGLEQVGTALIVVPVKPMKASRIGDEMGFVASRTSTTRMEALLDD